MKLLTNTGGEGARRDRERRIQVAAGRKKDGILQGFNSYSQQKGYSSNFKDKSAAVIAATRHLRKRRIRLARWK